MQIPINLIKPSPHPVRTSWDEEKMKELAQSIKEQGLIVPIKVRPMCPHHGQEFLDYEYPRELSERAYDGAIVRFEIRCTGEFMEDGEIAECDINTDLEYEIVYGHRRVEASKRAGLTEVEAIVDGVDDTSALVQALIENIQREDMTDLEKAYGMQELYNNEMSGGDIARRMGWVMKDGSPNRSQVRRYLDLLGKHKDVADAFYSEGGSLKTTPKDAKTKIEYIAAAIPDDVEMQKEIARKVVREELGQNKANQLAQSIAAAPSPQAKKRLLEWEYSPTIHDPELIRERAKTHGPHDPIYRDNKPSPAKTFEESPEIKMLLDSMTMAIKTFIDLLSQIKNVANIGKLAPEGKQFMAHKLRSFRDQIDQLLKELEAE